MRLTPDQVRFYQDHGYLAVEGVIPPGAVAVLRDRLDWLCEHWDTDDGKRARVEQEADVAGAMTAVKSATTVRKFNDLALSEPIFRDHARSAALLDLVEDLIDAPVGGQRRGVLLYGDQAFMKPPRVGSRKELHQDNHYFRVEPAGAVVTAWCALDDATLENGCMHYAPGSHRLGLLEHEDIPGTPHSVPRGRDAADAVAVPVRAGGVIFHHSLTLHYSPPNLTDRWRRAYATHYARAGAHLGIYQGKRELTRVR